MSEALRHVEFERNGSFGGLHRGHDLTFDRVVPVRFDDITGRARTRSGNEGRRNQDRDGGRKPCRDHLSISTSAFHEMDVCERWLLALLVGRRLIPHYAAHVSGSQGSIRTTVPVSWKPIHACPSSAEIVAGVCCGNASGPASTSPVLPSSIVTVAG